MTDSNPKRSLPGLSKARWVLYKELNSFFGSNLPPLALGIVAFLCGLVSVVIALNPGATYEAVTRVIFYLFYIIIAVASIFLSMSSFVSERRGGTLELLYTLPVTDIELVLGKFLMGVILIVAIATSITLIYVAGIAEAPWYMVVSGLYGLILVGLYAYSVGLFASSLTDSYLVALLISAAILLTIDITGFLAGLMPSPAKEIFTHMHALNQYNPFSRGVIAFKSSVFFISLIALFLFLTTKVLESRRWRGQTG